MIVNWNYQFVDQALPLEETHFGALTENLQTQTGKETQLREPLNQDMQCSHIECEIIVIYH